MSMRELTIAGGQPAIHLGRECVLFTEDAPALVQQGELLLGDGTLEIDVSVTGERSFPGLAWRVQGNAYEAFFIRPHQMGNPDACQYTPVFNDVFAWQLYHSAGFWAPIEFPFNEWFRVRVCFAGDRGEAYVVDMDEPALVFDRLRVPTNPGGIGLLPSRSGSLFARLAYDAEPPKLRGLQRPAEAMAPGVVPGWWVSNLVTEGAPIANVRTWEYLESEPSGLANLARVHPLGQNLNTVFARSVVRCATAGTRVLELGFSDRVVVFLNGRPVFAGRDDYRSRDYRFLGSIGWYDRLYLQLEAGDNELLIAVSETFGGWGVQARFSDPSGISFGPGT